MSPQEDRVKRATNAQIISESLTGFQLGGRFLSFRPPPPPSAAVLLLKKKKEEEVGLSAGVYSNFNHPLQKGRLT